MTQIWQVVHVFVSSSWLTYCMKESVTCSMTHVRGKSLWVKGLRRLSFFDFNPHIKSKNTSKLDKSSRLEHFISEKNKKIKRPSHHVAHAFSRCVSAVTEYCQVMFDYKGKAEDELDLKKGEIVVVLKKVDLFVMFCFSSLLWTRFSRGCAL